MKRSKILRYLENVFYENNLDPDEAMEEAEMVLSKLEEFGLQPPISHIVLKDEDGHSYIVRLDKKDQFFESLYKNDSYEEFNELFGNSMAKEGFSAYLSEWEDEDE